MAITQGRLEGRISTVSYAMAANEGGGAQTATLDNGTYYLSTAAGYPIASPKTLLAALKEKLDNTSLTGVFTCTLNANGTVTISSTVSFTAVWTSSNLRDLLGFTADLTPTNTTFTGTRQARSLWLPDCAFQSKNALAPWKGRIESSLSSLESKGGHVWGMSGPRKYVLVDLTWPEISRAKAWEVNESLVNASYERFYIDVILGEADWSQNPLGPIRVHPNEADAATYDTYKCGAGFENYDPAASVELWTGRWAIRMPRLVRVPA